MATVYRDYGSLNDTFPRNDFNVTQHRQVYQATHGGDGNRLPLMRRSFISFSYGGKLIEDFDLIASISGDRMEKDGYSSFNDLTTEYDILEGQQYWNTHFKTNTIEFNLATDGIDQKTLDNFLHWFVAGVSRELILSEHPNRAQLARVAEPPQLHLLPFEHHTTMKVSGYEYDVTTTLYKGEITLKLITDEPHWYAKENVLGKKVSSVVGNNITQQRYIDVWEDTTVSPPQEVNIFASQDALKILYEDGIPLGSMIENNMLLGNKAYASVENNVQSLVWSLSESEIVLTDGEINGQGARIHGTVAAGDESQYTPGSYVGVIAGAIVDVSGNGILSLAANQDAYFFYAGTAPSPTIISFDVPMSNSSFDSNGYFQGIANKYTNVSTPYSTFTIESTNIQELRITTSNLFSSYNEGLKILLEIYPTKSLLETKKEVLKRVHHPYVRKWISYLIGDDETADKMTAATIRTNMIAMFKNNSDGFDPLHFSFNSKTGEATGTFTYRKPIAVLSGSTIAATSTADEYIEDVGDMLLSNNIVLVERNYPNSYGKIVKWENTTEGRTYSHRLYHNLPSGISNLQIEYKYMYL